jgi:hypothetical protein
MKTAGEVNAAILESLSQGREAKMVGLLKLLQWGEALLEERAEFPKVRRKRRIGWDRISPALFIGRPECIDRGMKILLVI